MRHELRQLTAATAAGYLASLGVLRICEGSMLHFEDDLPVLTSTSDAEQLSEQMTDWIGEHLNAERLMADLDFKERNPLAYAWAPFAKATWDGTDQVAWTRLADGSVFGGTNAEGQWRHLGGFAVNGSGRSKPQKGLVKVWRPEMWRAADAEEILDIMRQGLRQILEGSMLTHYVRSDSIFFLTETDRSSTRRSGANSPIAPLWELLGAVGTTLLAPSPGAVGLLARHWTIPLTAQQAPEVLLAAKSTFPEYLHPLVDAPGKSKAFGERENTRV